MGNHIACIHNRSKIKKAQVTFPESSTNNLRSFTIREQVENQIIVPQCLQLLAANRDLYGLLAYSFHDCTDHNGILCDMYGFHITVDTENHALLIKTLLRAACGFEGYQRLFKRPIDIGFNHRIITFTYLK